MESINPLLCNHAATAASDTTSHIAETIREYMQADSSHSNILDYGWSHSDWSAFGELSLYSIMIGVIVALALFLIRAAACRASGRFRDVSLKWAFCFVWLYGFVVYDVGMCTGQYISLLTNAPMAILYAFKIFLYDSDVSEIHEIFHQSWVYSLNFALVHFFAAIISTLFVIKYFGFNIMARLKMLFASGRWAKTVRETFVFWGLNEASVHLIESIKEKYGDSGSYRIVIVRNNANEDKESEGEHMEFARIFDFLAMPGDELERLQQLGCLSTGSYANLANINSNRKNEDILGAKLKLRSLKKLLQNKTSEKIHLLFLSDDEKENLHDVATLLNDSTLRDFAFHGSAPGEVTFYCLARYNSIHRVIEDQHPSDRVRVKVVDASHINVELLKLDKDLLPVNFVNVTDEATVASAFNALVIGFSEVGLDSVRFLYEFGAFVDKGSTDKNATRSEFHLDVVDKHMADLAGTFVANAPAIKPSLPFIKNGENKEALITLHNMDCRSVEFYQKLTDEWIQKLNYIVIATNDDELNLSMGIRIFKAAARCRADLKQFAILVRAHNDDDGHIRRIAEHYNRLWAAYGCAPETEGKRIHQTEIHDDDVVKGPVHVFGLDSSTFTYDNIIADELEQNARRYAQKYAETTNPAKKYKVSAWDDTFNEMMQLDGQWAGYAPTYFGLMNLRRVQAQDIANSMHEQTKKILRDKALEINALKHFQFSTLTRMPNTTTYIWPQKQAKIDKINRIAMTLAQTEHLRWCASHEILGYTYAENKDEVRLEHDCLKDWSELTERVQSYDNNVSDYILGIRFSE